MDSAGDNSLAQAIARGAKQWNGYPLPGSGYSDGIYWPDKTKMKKRKRTCPILLSAAIWLFAFTLYASPADNPEGWIQESYRAGQMFWVLRRQPMFPIGLSSYNSVQFEEYFKSLVFLRLCATYRGFDTESADTSFELGAQSEGEPK